MATPKTRLDTSADAIVAGARILVVEARFHTDIADMLWAGAERRLEAAGASVTRLTLAGALEIPTAIAIACDAAAARGAPFDGAVALGCVIRGDTFHFEIVAMESSRALMDLSVARKLPLGNGILTVDTEAQAIERADPARLDKGGDAVAAMLMLVALARRGGRP